MKRVKLVIIWVLSVLIALVMVQQGWAKLFEGGRWTQSFVEWGYPGWFRILIGGVEVGGALLLFVPRLAFYGGVGLAAVMIGAFGTLVLDGRTVDAITPLVYTVVLGWIVWERRRGRIGAPDRLTS